MAQARGLQAPQQRQVQPTMPYQQHPQAYQQPTPAPQWQQQPQYQQPQQPPPPVTIANLWDAMKEWRGGKAHRVDAQPCPECGGNQYYSRSDGARRGPPPAPHCYNCGYNGLFEQGEAATWGAST
jgi:predicted RNA-binding Zn-ribbon protein involved in translation (DUF1610 family)